MISPLFARIEGRFQESCRLRRLKSGTKVRRRCRRVQQLSFEELNVAQIAKRTAVKKAVVEAGIKVAESEFAGKLATKHEVTLDPNALPRLRPLRRNT